MFRTLLWIPVSDISKGEITLSNYSRIEVVTRNQEQVLLSPDISNGQASLWADAWQRLRRNRAAVASAIVLTIITILAIVGPMITPYSYEKQNLMESDQPPSARHWLGTNRLGQDVLARLLMGARVSLAVALVAQLVIVCIGVPAGLLSGYLGGWVDDVIMRFMEVIYSIPTLLFVILITTLLRETIDAGTGALIGPLRFVDDATGGLSGVVLGIGLVFWVGVARLVRGEVLTLKERDFVAAARSIGASKWRIMARHLLPNVLSPIIVTMSYGIPEAIFLEAGLSFMGLGVRPPMPSWGLMISRGSEAIQSYPHLVASPAIILAVTMVCFTFLGDGVRDALDPQLKKVES